MMKNGTLMQYFEWYLPADATLWKKAAEEADKLGEMVLQLCGCRLPIRVQTV